MFDPCPLGYLAASNPFVLEEEMSGLCIPWADFNFVNPPYSEIAAWIEKAYHEARLGKFVCLLIPARTDTKYFHRFLVRCSTIYFVEGRLKFNGSKNSAPFPSMVCIYGVTGVPVEAGWPQLRTMGRG